MRNSLTCYRVLIAISSRLSAFEIAFVDSKPVAYSIQSGCLSPHMTMSIRDGCLVFSSGIREVLCLRRFEEQDDGDGGYEHSGNVDWTKSVDSSIENSPLFAHFQ